MSGAEERRTATLHANRALWLNLLEDLPLYNFRALKTALLAQPDLLRFPNAGTKLRRAKSVTDVRLSNFKYTTEAFSTFLSEFIDENNVKVGERPVPIAEEDVADWQTLPRAYLERFIAKPTSQSSSKKSRSTKRRRVEESDDSDEEPSSVDIAKPASRSSSKLSRSAKRRRVEEPAESSLESSSVDTAESDNDEGDVKPSLLPPPKRQKVLENELQMLQASRDAINELVVEFLKIAHNYSHDKQMEHLGKYLSMLSKNMGTLNEWNDRIQNLILAHSADRDLIIEHMKKLWSAEVTHQNV